jgi:hypothetical protein
MNDNPVLTVFSAAQAAVALEQSLHDKLVALCDELRGKVGEAARKVTSLTDPIVVSGTIRLDGEYTNGSERVDDAARIRRALFFILQDPVHGDGWPEVGINKKWGNDGEVEFSCTLSRG